MAPPLPPVAPQRFRGNRRAITGESAPRGGTGKMARDPNAAPEFTGINPKPPGWHHGEGDDGVRLRTSS